MRTRTHALMPSSNYSLMVVLVLRLAIPTFAAVENKFGLCFPKFKSGLDPTGNPDAPLSVLPITVNNSLGIF